jgi:hypothetical protein
LAIVSSTEKSFEKPTLAAIRQWKFTPATRDGVAVSTPVRQTISFRLLYLHNVNATAMAGIAAKPNESVKGGVAVSR